MRISNRSSTLRRAVATLAILLTAGSAHADQWIGGSGLVIRALEPLPTYGGGMIRSESRVDSTHPICAKRPD